MAEPLVPLGEIVGTHGLKGWLKLNPFNPATTALSSSTEVIVEKSGSQSVHELEAGSPHKHQWLIKLRDLNSIDEASRYVGATLAVACDYPVGFHRHRRVRLESSENPRVNSWLLMISIYSLCVPPLSGRKASTIPRP